MCIFFDVYISDIKIINNYYNNLKLIVNYILRSYWFVLFIILIKFINFLILQENTNGSRLRKLPATISKPEEANRVPCLPVCRAKPYERWKGHDDAFLIKKGLWLFSDCPKKFYILFDKFSCFVWYESSWIEKYRPHE